MARPKGPTRMEVSGSLTPELEGAARTLPHPRRTGGEKPAGRKPNGRP